MKKKLSCILLVDDREDCNYMHKLILNSINCVERIEVALDGDQAIKFLTTKQNGKLPQPEIIFLDINMPVMDGWEFLEEYEKLSVEQKSGITLVMLSSSMNPKDKERASSNKNVNEFLTKYLDETSVQSVLEKYFQDYL